MALSTEIIPYPLKHQLIFADNLATAGLCLNRDHTEAFARFIGINPGYRQIRVSAGDDNLNCEQAFDYMTKGYCFSGDLRQPTEINANYLIHSGGMSERVNKSIADALAELACQRVFNVFNPINVVRSYAGFYYATLVSQEKNFWVMDR